MKKYLLKMIGIMLILGAFINIYKENNNKHKNKKTATTKKIKIIKKFIKQNIKTINIKN